jgi:hypothetical protein
MYQRASNNQQYIYWLLLFQYEDPVVLGKGTQSESNKNLLIQWCSIISQTNGILSYTVVKLAFALCIATSGMYARFIDLKSKGILKFRKTVLQFTYFIHSLFFFQYIEGTDITNTVSYPNITYNWKKKVNEDFLQPQGQESVFLNRQLEKWHNILP